MMDGRVPYRDFTTGYPPLAAALFAPPRLLAATRDVGRVVQAAIRPSHAGGRRGRRTDGGRHRQAAARSTTATRALLLFAAAASLLSW